MTALWNAELWIPLFLQGLGGWLLVPMQALTALGRVQFFMVLMPALYWCVDTGVGFRAATMLLLGTGLNDLLKLSFHTPRPYWFSAQVKALGGEGTFGFPSGHAETAAGVWGLLAVEARKTWAWLLAAVLVLLIGVSRVYLGVHFASDVVAGWAIGILSLMVFLRVEKPLARWFAGLSFWQQSALGMASSLWIIGMQLVAVRLVRGLPFPLEWALTAGRARPDTVLDPLMLTDTVIVAGTWLGMCAGAAYLRARGGLAAGGSLPARLARFLVGMAGLALLYLGLGAVLPRGEDLISYSLAYGLYTLVGFWVGAGAPLVFIRLGLASAKEAPVEREERIPADQLAPS
ncbi:MAG TPA: phosphatase PAP2 family protein [Anaerolineaceae bacterium]